MYLLFRCEADNSEGPAFRLPCLCLSLYGRHEHVYLTLWERGSGRLRNADSSKKTDRVVIVDAAQARPSKKKKKKKTHKGTGPLRD